MFANVSTDLIPVLTGEGVCVCVCLCVLHCTTREPRGGKLDA